MISVIIFRLSLLSLCFIGIFYGHLAEQAVCNSKKIVTIIFVLAAFFNLSLFLSLLCVFFISLFYSTYMTCTFFHRAAVLFFIIILTLSCQDIDLISKSFCSSLSFVSLVSFSVLLIFHRLSFEKRRVES